MREVVRVAPRNAVERDVVLAVLEATDGSDLRFHQARAVRRDRVDARRDGHGIGVVASGWNVFLNVRAADNRLRLRGDGGALGGGNCAYGRISRDLQTFKGFCILRRRAG